MPVCRVCAVCCIVCFVGALLVVFVLRLHVGYCARSVEGCGDDAASSACFSVAAVSSSVFVCVCVCLLVCSCARWLWFVLQSLVLTLLCALSMLLAG